MRLIQLTFWLAVVAAFVLSCEESKDEVDHTLDVTSMSVLIFEEGTYQLTATLYDEDSVEVDEEITFTSSDDSIATVDAVGMVTGVADGETEVIVSYDDLSITVSVRVVAAFNFTKYSGNPVMLPGRSGAWDYLLFHPSVLMMGSTYHMWYQGGWGSNARIGHATSPDGLDWTRDSNPVLAPGEVGDFDEYKVLRPSVLYIDSEYKMWYIGSSFEVDKNVCYATSTDGTNWIKHPDNPLFGITQSWEDSLIEYKSVLYNGSGYMMWYSTGLDSRHSFGLATSDDGIVWTKYSGNPVMTRDLDSWEENAIQGPIVLYIDGIYHMIYYGEDTANWSDGRFGHAVSEDGINWLKYHANPIFGPGPGIYDIDGTGTPEILYEDGNFKMWYTGGPDVGNTCINYAISE